MTFKKGYKPYNKTHNLTHSRTYNSWTSMKQRCSKKSSGTYNSYFDKGIKVCDRWLNSFENFLEDMGTRPDNMSLDRIDNSKDYEPLNCKWSTYTEQNNNRSSRGRKGSKINFI